MISFSVVILAAGFFMYKKVTAIPPGMYKWDGVLIEAQSPPPDRASMAAEWGPAQVTLQDLWSRSPAIKEKPQSPNEVQQLAAESEYYFTFLSLAQNLLIEKLTAHHAKLENLSLEAWIDKTIPPYISGERDFAQWKSDQKIPDSALKPTQIESIKSDFKYKYQTTQLRQYFSKKINTPLKIFIESPREIMEWPTDGIAPLGPAKAKPAGLFLCDLISQGCFQALEILQQVTQEMNIKINFKPALSGDQVYSALRSQVGLCLAKISAEKFWSYFATLSKQPPRLEEPELYALTGLNGAPMNTLRACMVTPELRSEWEQHLQFFKTLWNPALPTLVLYGEPILGPFSKERVTELISRRKK